MSSREELEDKKREIDEYFAGKDPADYGAVRIGPVGPPGAHVIGETYETTNLIVIKLDEHGLRLRDGYASEDVSDKSVAEIIETIEEWAQTFRDMDAEQKARQKDIENEQDAFIEAQERQEQERQRSEE